MGRGEGREGEGERESGERVKSHGIDSTGCMAVRVTARGLSFFCPGGLWIMEGAVPATSGF